MPKKRNLNRPAACKSCAGTDLVRRITTYPVMLTGQLEGKEIVVGRVPLYLCKTCGHLMPTAAGQAKVDHMIKHGTELFLNLIR